MRLGPPPPLSRYPCSYFPRVAHTPARFAAGSVLSALYFLVLWPITIAIIAPIWGGKNMAHTWVPEAIKLVFGESVRWLFFPRATNLNQRARGMLAAAERRASQKREPDAYVHPASPPRAAQVSSSASSRLPSAP